VDTERRETGGSDKLVHKQRWGQIEVVENAFGSGVTSAKRGGDVWVVHRPM